MDLSKIKTFHTDEVLPILSEVKGPVDSFVVKNDREVVETAAKTGVIVELLEYLQQAKINPMDGSHADLLERAKQEHANGGV